MATKIKRKFRIQEFKIFNSNFMTTLILEKIVFSQAFFNQNKKF